MISSLMQQRIEELLPIVDDLFIFLVSKFPARKNINNCYIPSAVVEAFGGSTQVSVKCNLTHLVQGLLLLQEVFALLQCIHAFRTLFLLIGLSGIADIAKSMKKILMKCWYHPLYLGMIQSSQNT